jgi:opacity protein-like surface antigen
MRMPRAIVYVVTVANVFVGHAALADDFDNAYDAPAYDSYAWSEPRLASRIGIGAAIGVGFGQFTDDRATTALATEQLGWSFRATFGTHIPIGIEGSYVGTLSNIDTPLDDNARLLGTEFDAVARWNILPHYAWNPFVFGGVGWQRYDVTHADLSVADTGISDSDELAVFPVGAGIAYRGSSGLTLDVRGTYHAASESDLIVDSAGVRADLDSWDASAALGYEF